MILPMLLLVVCRCETHKLWELAPEDEKEGAVIQVHVVHGSGHVEPPACYPADPHARAPVWKHGPGELTQHGRRQGFYFGENLRSRYLHLLPKECAYKYVKALSAKTTRSQMTSSMVLAGLLPPKGDDVWSSITWQPAVVNVDDILTSEHCDRLQSLKKNVVYDIKSDELYLKVSSNTKKTVKTPLEMLKLYMCLEIQNQAGLEIPAWARGLYSQMRREAAKGYQFNSDISRLAVGRILDTITKFNEYDKDNRINLYSIDNTVIGDILAALRFNQTEPPNFLSALVVEIRERHQRYHAQLWYRVGPFDDLVRLYWPGCVTRCSLAKLRTLLDPLIPKEWSRECEQVRLASNATDIVMVSLVLLAFVLVYVATASGNRIYHYVTEFTARRKRSVKTEA